MSTTTPTTREISDNIVAQFEASLNQTVPLLPKSFLRVLARALAGVFVILYKYGGFMFLQIFVRTATISSTQINGRTVSPLLEWGRLIGVGDPAPATNAELLITVTVETQSGNLPSGTQLVNSDNGVTYVTVGAIALDAPTKTVTIRAVSDQAGGGGAGAIGNLDPGEVVSFANPIGRVARNAIVDSQTITGADGEATEAYRQRVIDRFQKRPQGGAYADYEQWGSEPAGIVNIYPYTSANPGQVDVYVEATPTSSGSPDGIPTAAQLEEVKAAIFADSEGLSTRRPANALANTFAITRTGFDVRVLGLDVDDLGAVRGQIEDALTEYFLDREPFILGLSVPPRQDRITRSALAGVVDRIVSASGGIFSAVVISRHGLDLEVYSLGIGEKSKLNSVSWV